MSFFARLQAIISGASEAILNLGEGEFFFEKSFFSKNLLVKCPPDSAVPVEVYCIYISHDMILDILPE